jgi:hypothetical protein
MIHRRNDWMLHEPDHFVESVLRNHPGIVTFFCMKDYGEGIWAATDDDTHLEDESLELFRVVTTPNSTPESVLLSMETLFLAESLRNPEFQAWLDTKWCEMFGDWSGEYEEL